MHELGALLNGLRATTEKPTNDVAVGVDESLPLAPINDCLRPLVSSGTVGTVFALWFESRVRANGEIFTAGGGSPFGHRFGLDSGKRRSLWSWPDSRVVQHAIAYLYSYKTVVILTADRAGNVGGLRPIVHQIIRKPFDEHLSGRNNLIILLKRPRSSAAGYAKRVANHLMAGCHPRGFSEFRL